jgi:hypothetical protein
MFMIWIVHGYNLKASALMLSIFNHYKAIADFECFVLDFKRDFRNQRVHTWRKCDFHSTRKTGQGKSGTAISKRY